MATSERRMTPRFKIHIPVRFHRLSTPSEKEQGANSLNISTRGVYFVTNHAISAGEAVEVLLRMPKRVTGAKASSRWFRGRVTHVEFTNIPQGYSGVGVQLLYYVPAMTTGHAVERQVSLF